MKTVFTVVVFICLLFSMTAYAEYYQYKGADGTVHYTDDLGDVPQGQRPDVKHYKDVQSPPPPATETRSASPASSSSDSAASASPGTINSRMQAKAEQLQKEREGLTRTYNELEAERKKLGPPPGRNASENEIRAYKDKLKQLNERIKKYKKDRKAFQKKVAAFNAQVKNAKQK